MRSSSLVAGCTLLVSNFAAALVLTRGASAQCPPQWSSLGSGVNSSLFSFAVFDEDGGGPGLPALFASGAFSAAGGGDAFYVARWNGSAWSAVGGGTANAPPDAIFDLAVYDDDGPGPHAARLIAGGQSYAGMGLQLSYLAAWDGSQWSSELGGGLGGAPNHWVRSLLAFDDDGSAATPAVLVVSGEFTSAGGVPAQNIAAFDGSTWTALGGGLDESAAALAAFDEDGSGPNPPSLFAGGAFTVPASRVARWDGASWTAVGGGADDTVRALLAFDDDAAGPHAPALYAGGHFASVGGVAASHVAKWNGTVWSALGSGADDLVLELGAFDAGGSGPRPPSLHAAGSFSVAGGVAANRIARWNGSAWSALGAGLSGGTFSWVDALAAFDRDGGGPEPAALHVGGLFTAAGGAPASNVARWSGCEPSLTPFCFGDGSSGPCPCGNSGGAARGCQNSASTGGAQLSATGAPSLFADSLVLTSAGELPSAFSIFLQGDALVGPLVYGDGLRCTGGSLKRLYSRNASSGTVSAPVGGDPSVSARAAALGAPIPPGGTRRYQTYYRDPAPGFCSAPPGNTWNVSSGLIAVWSP